MNDTITIGQTIYPHKRREEWEAPSYEVAQRWVDEVKARSGEATAEMRSSGVRVQWIAVVWVTVTAPTHSVV